MPVKRRVILYLPAFILFGNLKIFFSEIALFNIRW